LIATGSTTLPPLNTANFTYLDPPPAPVETPVVPIARLRPPALVFALTALTFGLYAIVWLGLTWAEMKRDLRNPRMRPVWHALSMFAPIYSLFRFWAHFSTLHGMRSRFFSHGGFHPGAALALYFIASALEVVNTAPLPAAATVLLTVGYVCLFGLVCGRGQQVLNEYWSACPGRARRTRIHFAEVVTLILGGLLFALFLIGTLRTENSPQLQTL